MKQMKKTNRGWKFLSMLPLAGFMAITMGLAAPALAGPDLQVRVWVDANSVHKNANNTYNFTIRGQLKNVGNADYVSRNNQQVLFLHEARKAHHITDWHFSRLNQGQVMKVHVPVINHPGGEFVPAYELALSFDPDIYMDRNPANDDRNRRNNQATVSSRTISSALARARGPMTVRPVGVRPGVIRPNIISPNLVSPRIKTKPVIHPRPIDPRPRGKKPDLIPVVRNPFNGVITVKNIGFATAGASKVVISCKKAGHRGPGGGCVYSPSLNRYYDASLGGMAFPIPALRPGQSQRVNIPGWSTLHGRNGGYNFTVMADGGRVVAESNERNNKVLTSMKVRGKPQPRGKKPDLIPVLRGSNPFKLKFKVKNQGRVTAGASKLVIICKRIGYRGPGGGCADSPSLHRYYDTASNGLVISVPALRAGQTYIPRFRVKRLKWAKGKYKFTFNADATRAVAESNERNNRQSTTRRR